MAEYDFPEGMSTCNVGIQLSAFGKAGQGYLQVFAERKFGYIGSPWTSDLVSNKIRTTQGSVYIKVPHSDQPGLTGDMGAELSDPVAYQFVFSPLRSGPIDTLSFVYVPMSKGDTVNLNTIADLGGWPHQTVITLPGGGGGTGTYVPVTIGGSTYWSPA